MCGEPSMIWMLMPGQTWPGAAASFGLMWVAMMVPMMLPSLAPALWRYRQAIGRDGVARWAPLTVTVAAGYFFVWALLGLAVYPLGVLFAETGTHLAAGAVVLAAGAMQFGAWKRRQLDCCREAAACCAALPANAPTAWLHGMHLGARCALCCGNLMAVLLVVGLMDLRAMAAATAAITLERLTRGGPRIARGIGGALAVAGLWLIVRALG